MIDLNAVEPELPATLLPFVELGQPGIERAAHAVERSRGSAVDGRRCYRAADVTLHAPWPGKRIACAGGNYAAHSLGMAINRGVTDVTLESMTAQIRKNGHRGFWKVLDAVAGPGDNVPYPSRAEYLDYEGEVAIVIGKRGKNIAADEIDAYVWGVTLANDWSDRDMGGANFSLSYNVPKNFDLSASLGPCIVVGEVDPQDVNIETRVNGDLRQRYSSRDMVFSFAEILAYLSTDFTFVPGDVILGGTGAGTAQDSTKLNADGSRPHDRFLKAGDVVEISSPAIGNLTNRVV